jgi:hypothetical protein
VFPNHQETTMTKTLDIQRRMLALGYDPARSMERSAGGPIRAIRAFQLDAGLESA